MCNDRCRLIKILENRSPKIGVLQLNVAVSCLPKSKISGDIFHVYRLRMNAAPIQILLATIDDLSKVQSCAHAAYAKYVVTMGREPAPMVADFASQIELGQVQVAKIGSSLAGYVVFYREVDHIHLENVAVDPAHAGNGVGKRLIEYVEQTARNEGLAAVELYTNEAMTENLAMYPKLGYLEIERKWQEGFNRVFYRKTI